MSSRPWYRWFSADYRAKTAHLDFIHDAAYRRLLDAYYEHRGPLPADPKALYRIVGAQTLEERAAVMKVAGEFFSNGDGLIRQARADEEILETQEFAARRAEAGRKGNDVRWGKNRNRIAQRSQNDRHPHPQSQPLLQSQPQSSPQLPPWLPPESWSHYQDHRKNKRAKLTPRAAALCFRTLEKLREKGQDPIAVIEQSIANGWTGLFPVQAVQQKAQDWKRSEQATEAKARELGMWPARAGESWNDLRRRIEERLNAANN